MKMVTNNGILLFRLLTLIHNYLEMASARDIIEVQDGFVVAGHRSNRVNFNYPGGNSPGIGGPSGWDKCWIGELNKQDGHLMWQHYYGIDTADNAYFYGITQANDSGFVLCGNYNFDGNTEEKGWVVKTDAAGDSMWATIINHPLDSIHYTDQMELHTIHEIGGGYMVSGIRIPGWPVQEQAFPYVFAIDSTGCWALGCSEAITDVIGIASIGVAGLFIYPIPATNQLIILATGFQPQTIAIYNLSGEQVINLPFAHEVDISILPPGVYFVEVTGAQSTEVRKLVKM